jgi:hypothetical protein
VFESIGKKYRQINNGINGMHKLGSVNGWRDIVMLTEAGNVPKRRKYRQNKKLYRPIQNSTIATY